MTETISPTGSKPRFTGPECADGSAVDTGEKYTDGRPMTLECVDGDKLLMNAATNGNRPIHGIPYERLSGLWYQGKLLWLKYWPWDELRITTLQKATISSDAD